MVNVEASMMFCFIISKIDFKLGAVHIYIIHSEGRGGKAKYDDHIIEGGGGLETALNGQCNFWMIS